MRNIDGAICAFAVRSTLEKMCKDKGEIKGSLYDKLKNLSKKGVLPPILDEIADVLRDLGNAAAHAMIWIFLKKLLILPSNSLKSFSIMYIRYQLNYRVFKRRSGKRSKQRPILIQRYQ